MNEQIRIPNVRLFDDETNEPLGIVAIDQARLMAIERELDLVEVAPQAVPPVCRLMDYGRFKFEALKKEKESRREHSVIRVKEMKLRPKISEHDFQTKFGYVRHFLKDGDKVKLTIMFRGREMVHQEYGRKLLDRMAEELKEMAIVERSPLVEGRNMIMILSPVAKKVAKGEHHGDSKPMGGAADAAPHADSSAPSAPPAPAQAKPAATAAPAPVEAPAATAPEPTPEATPVAAPAEATTPKAPAVKPAAPKPAKAAAAKSAPAVDAEASASASTTTPAPAKPAAATKTTSKKPAAAPKAAAKAGKGVTSSDAQDSDT